MPTQAVILCGGQGMRMRPLSLRRPKALVSVCGLPILEWQLRWLRKNGVDRIVISCGYRWDSIQKYVDHRPGDGLDIRLCVEPTPLGRGGGIRLAASVLPDATGPALALNGDLISDFPLGELATTLQEKDALAVLAVTQITTTWGVVELDGSLVTAFRQSPTLDYLGSAGVYCLSSAAMAMLPKVGDLEDAFFPELARMRRLAAVRTSRPVYCLDSVKDVLAVSELLMAGRVAIG